MCWYVSICVYLPNTCLAGEYVYLQYGAWATSKKPPCLHKAYYTKEVHTQIQIQTVTNHALWSNRK